MLPTFLYCFGISPHINHDKANKILLNNNLSQSILVEHLFNHNYLRLNISNIKQIDNLTLIPKNYESGIKTNGEKKISNNQGDGLKEE